MDTGLDEMSSRLRRLEDIETIRSLLVKIARGTDRYDCDLLASIVDEDAVLDMGSGRKIGGAAFVTALRPPAEPRPGRMHLVSNVRIDLEGDKARSESYIVSIQDVLVAGVRKTRIRAGRYLDRWERRGQGWKLFGRTLVDEWSRIDDVTEVVDAGAYCGRPAPDDLSYSF